MRTITTLGRALTMLLVLGAVSAGGATAHTWKQSGIPLTQPVSVSWTSKLLFEDTYHDFSYECTLAHKGTVGAGALGEIASITSTSGAKVIPCTVVNGGPGQFRTVEVEAYHLPWKTELVTLGGELRDLVSGGGWLIKASGLLGKETDQCASSKGTNTAMKNFGLGVEAIYDENSPATECTNTSGNKFKTSGVEDIIASAGELLVN